MWTAIFASPRKSEARVFTYAIAAKKPDIYKGVTIGRAIALEWPKPGHASVPDARECPVDSEAAYKVAATEAGKWLKEHPR